MAMWLFGYGSLIWKAGFNFDERLVGLIKDYRRVFYQGPLSLSLYIYIYIYIYLFLGILFVSFGYIVCKLFMVLNL